MSLISASSSAPEEWMVRANSTCLGVRLPPTFKDRATKETLPYDADLLNGMTDEMRRLGLIIRNDSRGDPTTQLCPPLVITREECDRVVDVLEQCFDKLGRDLGTVATRVAVS
jgi:4-aminobutyrate aminotransferase-like enzyme